jgi:putative ABC transport system substrate-binding protein
MCARASLLVTTVGLLVAALLLPLVSWSQPASRPARVAVLYPGADNDIFRTNFNGFRDGLNAGGYVEGRNLQLDIGFGDGRDLAALARDLLQRRPDLVLAVARPGVATMHRATPTVPVIALDLESDPVRSGFAKAIARPGGNVTGVFMDFPELAGKWLEILQGMVPTLRRVAVLWDPSTGSTQLDAARRAAETFKMTMQRVEARSTPEIEAAFRAALRERPNGMIVLTSPIFSTGRRLIAELAARHRLPTLMPFPGYAKDGGLVSYGPDVDTMYRQAATIALRVLAGTESGLLPIERPTRFVLSINAKTARLLGLSIPPPLLLRADEVFE